MLQLDGETLLWTPDVKKPEVIDKEDTTHV